MVEPVTATTFVKALTDAIGSFWSRSALLLACFTLCDWAILVVLYFGKRFQLDGATGIFASYALWLIVAGAVLPIVTAFKWWSERPKPSFVLLPDDTQSFWVQSKQPDGRITTQFALRFQATNVSDHTIKLSDISLQRPRVRRRSIIAKLLTFQHAKERYHSTQFSVEAHSLTYGSATVIVNRPIGRKGRPMRVVVRLQDHNGKWRRLVFPYLPPAPGT